MRRRAILLLIPVALLCSLLVLVSRLRVERGNEPTTASGDRSDSSLEALGRTPAPVEPADTVREGEPERQTEQARPPPQESRIAPQKG